MTTWTQRIGRLAAIALASLCFAAQAGEITAYTSLEEDDVKVYLDAFAKAKPGIKVNVLRLSTGDLAARMLAEKSNPRHDVIWGWAVTQMVDPRFLEMAEPYKPAGIDKVNAQFKDPDGRWFATTGYFAGFCVNTEVLKKNNLPMPTSWQDLLNPVYKGQIVMPNAASSGTGYAQVVSLLQMKGEEKGWQYLKDLDKNIAQYIKSGSRPCKAAATGEYAIGVSFAFSGVKQIMEGYPIKLVIPSEGAGYRDRGQRADEDGEEQGRREAVPRLAADARRGEALRRAVGDVVRAGRQGTRRRAEGGPAGRRLDRAVQDGLLGFGEEQGSHHRRVEAEDRTLDLAIASPDPAHACPSAGSPPLDSAG